MAKLGQQDTYNGKTFEEAMRQSSGSDKTKIYKDYIDYLQKINDLNDEQYQYLKDQFQTLDDILDNWDKLDQFIDDDLKKLYETGRSVKDIRNLLSEMLDDLRGSGKIIAEREKSIRNFRDLSRDIEQSLQVEGGAGIRNLETLVRKAEKQRELNKYTVQSLGTVAQQEQAILDLEAERGIVQNKLIEAGAALNKTKDAEKRARIRQNIKGLNDEASELNKQIKLRERNIDLIDLERQGISGQLVDQAKLNLEANRDVRRSTGLAGILSKGLEKLGFTGATAQYESYVQAATRVKAITAEQRKLNEEYKSLMGKDDPVSRARKEQISTRGRELSAEKLGAQADLQEAGGTPIGLLRNIVGGGIVAAVKAAAIAAATAIWVSLLRVSDQAAKLKQAVGDWGFKAAAANTQFATSAQYLETATGLAEQFGMNPMSFISPEGIARLAEAKNLMGYTAEQAGNLGIRAKIASQNVGAYEESIVRGINRGNALNRSAVAHGVAMKEVLATSDDITLSLGNSGEALGRAIVAAKNLGMNLKDVDRIADSLLDFESSIENEMKAQLLTGQQMNLSRARALALQNDLEGVAKEISSQGMTAAKFGTLNRIQQESFAKALGMSREELGRSLVLQAGITKLTDQQVKDATSMTKAQLEGMSITDRWKVATEKLMQAFTPLLEAIVPAVEFLSNIITGIAGFIGKIFSGASEGIGNVVKGLLILTGTVLTARLAFRLLGLVGKGAFAGLGVGIANTLRGVGLGIRGLIGSITPLATGGVGWAAVGMVAALGAAIAALGWGLGQAAPAIEAFGNLIKSVFEGIGSIVESTARGFKDIAAAIKELTLGDIGKLALLGPSMLSFSAGLTASIIPLNLFAFTGLPALRKITPSIKALTEGTVGAGNEASIRSAATTAAEERMEKIVTGIANRLNSTLNVHVDNWDIDKISRQLAVETANDFR